MPLYYRAGPGSAGEVDAARQAVPAASQRAFQLPAHDRRIRTPVLRTGAPRLRGHLARRFQAVRERVQLGRPVVDDVAAGAFLECASRGNGLRRGCPVPLRAEVDLAGLKPDDVRVEALVGRVGAEGDLEEVQVLVLEPREATWKRGFVRAGRRALRHRTPGVFGPRSLPTTSTTP